MGYPALRGQVWHGARNHWPYLPTDPLPCPTQQHCMDRSQQGNPRRRSPTNTNTTNGQQWLWLSRRWKRWRRGQEGQLLQLR